MDNATDHPHLNRLLAALSPAEYARLQPHLTLTRLPYKHVLYDVQQPIKHVYFVNSGVFSILLVTAKNETAEVAIVGNEGMVLLPSFLGSETANLKVVCQVPGEALRLPESVLRHELTVGDTLKTLLECYTQVLVLMLAQVSLCNRLHSVEERFCRWVLMTADRVEQDTFPLTHDLLAQMLGVRRASVTVVAGTMQRAGLIHYNYGEMTILDRRGLELGVCECYQSIRSHFDRLLDKKPS